MRAAFLFLLLVGFAFGALWVIDPTITITEEEAVRAELRAATSPEDLAQKIEAALEEDDLDTAEIYEDIAVFARFDLPEETFYALEEARSLTATVVRTTGQLVGGFFTGEAKSLAGLTGAVVSDLTVVGDVRDIAGEGSKLVRGEDYSELILGLSVVGIAATGATVATGGGGLPARVGVSILKVSAKIGALTADFAKQLGRILSRTVDFPGLKQTLRSVKLTDARATRQAVRTYARQLRTGEMAPVLARVSDIRQNAGAVESVRLMKFVKSTDDLDDVARMSKLLGKKTRGIIAITGKTSLRAFKTSLRVVRFILENLIAFASWVGGIFATLVGRRFFKLFRGVASGIR